MAECMVEFMVYFPFLICRLLVSPRVGRTPSFHSSAQSRSSADNVVGVIPQTDQFGDVGGHAAANADVWSWLNDISPSTASPPGMAILLLIIFIAYLSFPISFLTPFSISLTVLSIGRRLLKGPVGLKRTREDNPDALLDCPLKRRKVCPGGSVRVVRPLPFLHPLFGMLMLFCIFVSLCCFCIF